MLLYLQIINKNKFLFNILGNFTNFLFGGTFKANSKENSKEN